MGNITLKEWISNFKDGKYNSNDTKVQIDAGWYDWFCKKSQLGKKTKSLGTKVCWFYENILDNKFGKNMYVFFKNNCPLFGSLYDDFRICNYISGNVLFTIIPRDGYRNEEYKAQVWSGINNFDEAWLKAENWTKIKPVLKSKKEEIQEYVAREVEKSLEEFKRRLCFPESIKELKHDLSKIINIKTDIVVYYPNRFKSKEELDNHLTEKIKFLDNLQNTEVTYENVYIIKRELDDIVRFREINEICKVHIPFFDHEVSVLTSSDYSEEYIIRNIMNKISETIKIRRSDHEV